MGNGGRVLAWVGGGFVGLCIGALIGGCLGFLLFRETIPAGSYQQHASDWYGGMLDTAVHARHIVRTLGTAALGGLAGCVGGIVVATRMTRKGMNLK